MSGLRTFPIHAALALALWLAALPALALGQTAAGDPFAQALGGGEQSGGDPFAQALGGGEQSGGGGGFAATGAGAGGLELLGFIQLEQGYHFGPDGAQTRDIVLSNVRARLMTSLQGESSKAYLKLDFLNDGVRNESGVALREARVLWTPLDWLDLNMGVQVSTWGVGDMVFINDLFPKNWVANFTGQELEFLKEPANAMRVSVYPGPFTWDVVYTPQFAPDVVPDGCRFSVFDPGQQTLVARPEACETPSSLLPEQTGRSRDGELATRLMADVGPMQAALYGYRGFWKSPRGLLWYDPATGAPVVGPPGPTHVLMGYHPRLAAYGFSLEGQLGPGILSLEGGYYDSLDDPEGTDPFIENSAQKGLLGYRMDFSAAFTAGIQWLGEVMRDYQAYLDALPAGSPLAPREKRRNTYTLRLTYKAQQDTLLVHFFGYGRPEDRDGLYKLWLTKRVDNHLEVSTGANIFRGEQGYEDREFGMLRDDDNAFLRLTYNF